MTSIVLYIVALRLYLLLLLPSKDAKESIRCNLHRTLYSFLHLYLLLLPLPSKDAREGIRCETMVTTAY